MQLREPGALLQLEGLEVLVSVGGVHAHCHRALVRVVADPKVEAVVPPLVLVDLQVFGTGRAVLELAAAAYQRARRVLAHHLGREHHVVVHVDAQLHVSAEADARAVHLLVVRLAQVAGRVVHEGDVVALGHLGGVDELVIRVTAVHEAVQEELVVLFDQRADSRSHVEVTTALLLQTFLWRKPASLALIIHLRARPKFIGRSRPASRSLNVCQSPITDSPS